MQDRLRALILAAAVAGLVAAAGPHRSHATGADTETVPLVNTAPCLSAISAADDDKVVSECAGVIDNEKAARADRVKALIARAAVFARRDQADRAIADYDMVLRLDPGLADIFNARGELWRKKGDRPKALADFAAAIKLNPDHPTARGNYKSLALELERLGALMAVAGKPSFNCATARRAVEKTICANPELADLDRNINAANVRVVREAQTLREREALQREQDEFVARRNAEFGKPGYDLQQVMRDRLDHLRATGRQ
jgi:tetratricopeptide (TPR) repeat protein